MFEPGSLRETMSAINDAQIKAIQGALLKDNCLTGAPKNTVGEVLKKRRDELQKQMAAAQEGLVQIERIRQQLEKGDFINMRQEDMRAFLNL